MKKSKQIEENHKKSKTSEKIISSTGRQRVFNFLFRISIWEPKRNSFDQWVSEKENHSKLKKFKENLRNFKGNQRKSRKSQNIRATYRKSKKSKNISFSTGR